MELSEYLEYIDYFNSRQYDKYYTDDVVVELPSLTLEGKAAVKAFYRHMGNYVHETVRVKKLITSENALEAHIWSDFYCIKDWDEFPLRPVRRGDMIRVELVVYYKLRDGLFSHIRGARASSGTGNSP